MQHLGTDYLVRAKTPRDVQLSLVNAEQLLRRYLTEKPHSNYNLRELDIDKKKLDRCEVINITLYKDQDKKKKLFKVGRL